LHEKNAAVVGARKFTVYGKNVALMIGRRLAESGIPVVSGGLGGLDALLSTVQMPSGIPVATVAMNGAANAALLCIEMLAITDETLAEKLDAKRVADKAAVLEKDQKIAAQFN
jgi:5-(carboxyamino)imidazole ribonucleotide mutase